MLYKLEALRGICASLVILAHSPFLYGSEETRLTANSDLMVDFFFVLSGYVISLAYSEKIKSGMRFSTFLLLRLGRLYPLHLFMLLIWLALAFLSQNFLPTESLFNSNNNLSSFLSNLFLIHSLGLHDSLNWNFPSWSVSVEFFTSLIYFCLPFATRKSATAAVIISLIAFSILIFSPITNIGNATYDFGIFRCIGGFYLGVAIYQLKSIKGNLNPTSIAWLETIGFVISIACLTVLIPSKTSDLMIILVFACMIYIFADENSGFIGTFLKKRPFLFLGKISYSIYLLHAVVIYGLEKTLIHLWSITADTVNGIYSIFFYGAVLLCTITLSSLTYKYIEQPFRSLSKQIASKP